MLLLSSPNELSDDQVLTHATKCWGAAGKGRPPKLISPNPRTHIVQVANFFFSIHNQPVKYEIEGHELNEARQQVWDNHKAWISVDLPSAGKNLARSQWSPCYQLLLAMANSLWNDQCLGVYFPAEGVTVPGMGDIISSIKWSKQNGENLLFLWPSRNPADGQSSISSIVS